MTRRTMLDETRAWLEEATVLAGNSLEYPAIMPDLLQLRDEGRLSAETFKRMETRYVGHLLSASSDVELSNAQYCEARVLLCLWMMHESAERRPRRRAA